MTRISPAFCFTHLPDVTTGLVSEVVEQLHLVSRSIQDVVDPHVPHGHIVDFEVLPREVLQHHVCEARREPCQVTVAEPRGHLKMEVGAG